MTTILGTGGDDTLTAAAAGDQVYGLAGNDLLTNGYTDDLVGFNDTGLFGGAGNDTVLAADTSYDHTVSLLADGGFKDDLVAAIAYTDGQDASVTAAGGAGNDVVATGLEAYADVDSAIMGLQSVASGGDGFDNLTAYTGVEVAAVSSVDIEQDLSAGGNDDVLVSSVGVYFDTGVDGAYAVADVDAAGGLGNDDMEFYATVDSGAETFAQLDYDVDAGAGSDLVYAALSVTGEGSSAINVDVAAGDGADVVTLVASAAGSGDDAVTTSVDAGNGNDFVDVSMTGNDMVGQAFGGYGHDEMRIGMLSTGAGGFATIYMDGGVGNDTVLGDLGDLDGSSTVIGGYGNDILSVAGGSDNVLVGGAGNDTLTGSSQADRFVFGGSDTLGELADGFHNVDVITNYHASQGDVLEVTNGVSEVQSWTVVSGSTQLTMVGDHDLIVLQGVVISSLSDLLFA